MSLQIGGHPNANRNGTGTACRCLLLFTQYNVYKLYVKKYVRKFEIRSSWNACPRKDSENLIVLSNTQVRTCKHCCIQKEKEIRVTLSINYLY